LFAVPPLFT